MSIARALLVFSFLYPVHSAEQFVNGPGFLRQRDARVDLRLALEEALGQGHGHEIENLEDLKQKIVPTFTAAPKISEGRIDERGVRYLLHSYFLKEHGWQIRSFLGHETNATNATAGVKGPVGILNEKVPNYVDAIMRQPVEGYGVQEVVVMVALMQHLILQEGLISLSHAFEVNGFVPGDFLNSSELDDVLESYALIYALGNRRSYDQGKDSARARHRQEKIKILKVFPEWTERIALARDSHRNAVFPQRFSANPFSARVFSHEVIVSAMKLVTQGIGDLHQQECAVLKGALSEMDPTDTGRLPLGTFYARGTVGYWHLKESAAFMRHHGLLDESGWTGRPHVIISNYIQSPLNCDAPSEYISVCCVNECELLLNHFEIQVQGPLAKPVQILDMVANLPASASSAPRNLSSSLTQALLKVADHHNGIVPLHGRLFAQWLHYVFPHECPYPHMSGTIDKPLRAKEWFQKTNTSIAANEAEMQWHKDNHAGEASHMSMWTLEEEFRAGGAHVKSGLTHSLLVGSSQIALCCVLLLSLGRFSLNAFRTYSHNQKVGQGHFASHVL